VRAKNKILKFIFILRSIFWASFVAYVKAREQSRAEEEARDAEELQEQENSDILTSQRRR